MLGAALPDLAACECLRDRMRVQHLPQLPYVLRMKKHVSVEVRLEGEQRFLVLTYRDGEVKRHA